MKQRCRGRSREEHTESRYSQGKSLQHEREASQPAPPEGREGFTGEPQKQGATRDVPSCSSSACAHCCEAGLGSQAATLARSWASPSPAAWHSGAMPKEQRCKDGSRDGAHSPGREELPLSHTLRILVATSLHQLLLFMQLCTVLPDASHSTHVT